MKKLIYPDQNEELAKAVDGCFAKIILNDKMVKEASSNYLTREMLDECRPDKDHFLIHFIGVGDYERYGFNKNADAFTKEANEKYHKTFEKHAHLFREHNSSNPEVNAIGIIKKAMYNPEMGRTELAVWANIKKASEEYEKAKAGETLSCSMGCFPKGTKITKEDFTEVNIEDIKAGDYVLSGSNSIKKVDDVYNYKFTGNKITISVLGLPQKIVCTENHPIFIQRNKLNKRLQNAPAVCPVCGKHVKFLADHIKTETDIDHKNFLAKIESEQKETKEFFIEASDLTISDKIAVVSPEKTCTFFAITSLKTEFVEDFEVFNLNVAEDHTYIANGIVVHNCSVPYDVDSITGKHSKNPSEYEPHMKKHAGQFIPEFNKYAFVYNTEPKFFDLSIVARPAERIAHYLEYQFPELDKQAFVKAASEYNACIPSAILAEIEGLHYHLDSGFSDPDKAKLLNKLASYEKEFKDALASKAEDLKTKYIKYAAINSFSEEASELNDAELNDLVNLNVRPESIFREFAKRAAVMPFKTFCKYIYGDKLNKEAVKYASIHILPNVFEDLTKTDLDISELENLFNMGSVFDCACDNADSDPVQKLMNKAEEKFSVDDENLGKRIINITIIGSPSEETLANIIPNILSKQAGEVSDKLKQKAKEYASIYGVYKVAAINDILELNKSKIANEEQMLLSLIGQNYIYHH